MKLFESEAAARQYLEERVPPKEEDKKVDLSRLKENLFDISETVSPGHHEFEGPYGYKVSFDLVETNYCFNDVHEVYKYVYSSDNSGSVTGEFKPIYRMINVIISTPNFQNAQIDVGRPMSILWMPNLRSVHSELTHNFSHADKGEVYLIGNIGFLARPLDLLSFFHEAGHIATRTPETLVEERLSVKTTITADGVTTEPTKKAALELQRERDADAWLLLKTRKLFADLYIPADLIKEFIHHSQLKTYHEVYREVLGEPGQE